MWDWFYVRLRTCVRRLFGKRGPGKAWTHIAREGTRHRPMEWLLLFLLLGIGMGKFIPGTLLIGAVAILAAGIVVGHIWWGTPPDTWSYPGEDEVPPDDGALEVTGTMDEMDARRWEDLP